MVKVQEVLVALPRALPALQGTSATAPVISGGSALPGSVLGWAVTMPGCAGRDWDVLAVLEAPHPGPAGSVGAVADAVVSALSRCPLSAGTALPWWQHKG